MFKAIGGLGNISAILSNLQHIGPTVQKVTEQMRAERITGSAGDGAVIVTLNGIGEMLEIHISPIHISPIHISPQGREDPQLQAWIVEATNVAGSLAKQKYAQAISQAAEDLNLKLPGIDSLLKSLTGGA